MATKSEGTTALAVPPEPEPAGTLAPTWDDFDWQDAPIEGVSVIFPEIRVVQKKVATIANSEKHGGEFWLSDTEEFVSNLDGVFIHAAATRALFDDRNKNAPVCASDDALVPRPGQQVWQQPDLALKGGELVSVPIFRDGAPVSCAICPFNQRQGDNPPPCKYGFTVLLEFLEPDPDDPSKLLDEGRLYRMRWKGTAVKEMRTFLGRLRGQGARRNAKKVGRPSFSKLVHIYTEARSKDGNDWFAPMIDVTGDVDPALRHEYAAFATQLREQFTRTVAETHATDEGGDAGGDAPEDGEGAAPRWQNDEQFGASQGEFHDPDELPFE